MILADVTKGKKRLTIIYTKKKKKLSCPLITVKPEHPLSRRENSKMYVRAEAINHI